VSIVPSPQSIETVVDIGNTKVNPAGILYVKLKAAIYIPLKKSGAKYLFKVLLNKYYI
jgi:hypothetical protein